MSYAPRTQHIVDRISHYKHGPKELLDGTADVPESTLPAIQRDREAFEKVSGAVKTIIDVINGAGSENLVRSALIDGIINGHRYLQQGFLVTVLQALGDLGILFEESEARWTDARNRHAYGLLAKLRACLKDDLYWKE